MGSHKRCPAPMAVARRRYGRVLTRRGYAVLLLRLVILAAALWVLLSQVFLVIQAQGQGMYPAMEDGDLILTYRLQRDYRKGDVVVYQVAGERYIGRVAAVQEDVLLLDDSGNTLVNGTNQDGDILFPTYPQPGESYPLAVPEGTLYILGDHRTDTRDSREFGPIALKEIQGKVITILRRRGL